MATRNSDTRLDILLESPGSEHLRISGTRLPTYNQVLLCYLAYCEKFRNEDSTKNAKIYAPSLNAVMEQVSLHYCKDNIKLLPKACAWKKITNFHQ